MKSPYYTNDYFSPGWAEKANQIKIRDEFTCQYCGSHKKLTVHHKYYDDEKEIWDYCNEDLITLCWPCHQSQHYDESTDNYKMGRNV